MQTDSEGPGFPVRTKTGPQLDLGAACVAAFPTERARSVARTEDS